MRISHFRYGMVLACVLLVAAVVTAGSARAQSDAELKSLNQRVVELYSAGKYREAIPLAERYAKAGAEAVRRYDWPVVANQIMRVYETVAVRGSKVQVAS